MSHQELGRAIGEASTGERPTTQQLKDLLRIAQRSARTAGIKAVASGRWLTEVSVEAATHLPLRDHAALVTHHDGRQGAILAEALVRNAAWATATVGAATGALATASAATPATVLSFPVELAIETLLVVGIEMKLVGELHVAAWAPLPPGVRDKGLVIARSWADGRGLGPADIVAMREGGLGQTAASGFLGQQARDQVIARVQRRLLARTGRNLGSLLPFLAGAAIGGTLNRRATRNLGEAVAGSLGLVRPLS